MATSLLWRHLYLECSQCSSLPTSRVFFRNSPSVKQHCNGVSAYAIQFESDASNVWGQVFYGTISTCLVQKNQKEQPGCRLSEHLCYLSTSFWMPDAKKRCCLQPGRSFWLFAPNMYRWSRKTLVPIHWMHLKVNGICTESVCLQKMNNNPVPYGMLLSAMSLYI